MELYKIVNEKYIYEFLSLVFTSLIFIFLLRKIDNIYLLLYFIPTILFVSICLVMTPIMLKKEPTRFKDNIKSFYLILSFWFLSGIIILIWNWG